MIFNNIRFVLPVCSGIGVEFCVLALGLQWALISLVVAVRSSSLLGWYSFCWESVSLLAPTPTLHGTAESTSLMSVSLTK